MLNKEGTGYTYGQQGSKPHALTMASDGSYFQYDKNGNMVYRKLSTDETVLTYDFENRLVKSAPVSEETTINYDFWSTTPTEGKWYLISTPVLPADKKIPADRNSPIIQSSRYNSQTKKYEHYVDEPDYNQFETFDYLRSYFIAITYPYEFTLKGKRASPSSLQLTKGYNFVGSVSTTDIHVEAALKPLKLGVDYSKVYRYNAEGQAFEEYSAAKKEFTAIKPTEGLVVYCLKDVTWSPPTPTNTLVTEFAYDYEGNRVKKTANGKATIYIGNLYEKTDTTATNHIYLGLTRICTKTKGLSTTGTVPDTLYYHSDHLGSSNVITDSVGKRAQLAEYKPFGELKGLSPSTSEGTVPNYYFTGKELDSTGLYYYGARYYDAAIARFITPDNFITKPYNPQYLNRYSYCLNNPLRYIDPTGNYPGQSSNSGWSNWWSPFSYNSGSIFNTWSTFSNPFSSFSSGFSAASSSLGSLWQTKTFTVEDFLPSAQRGMSGFLGGINKTMDTMKWNDLWWNQRANAWGGALGYARSGVQGIGLLMGGFNIMEPFYREDLTVNQSYAMIWTKTGRAAGTAALITAGWYGGKTLGGIIGTALSGGIIGPGTYFDQAVGGGAGSILMGMFADRVFDFFENFVYQLFNVPLQ